MVSDLRHSRALAYLRALRIQQWAKNLLVFIPMLAGHKFTDAAVVMEAVLAFLAFGFCASAGYVLNDLHDLANDRAHPDKCHRPFASGLIPPAHGWAMIPLLLAGAAVVSLQLPAMFGVVLVMYLFMTALYSYRLKQMVLYDVFTLAGLYTLRIFAGAAAISVPVSTWLLALSIFLFFSLALVKRYDELRRIAGEGGTQARGRGYTVDDLHLVPVLGVASGLMAVLVLALYVTSEQVRDLYRAPDLLWICCAMLMFWICRIWMLSNRGQLHEDPVAFALRDRVSVAIALLGLVIFWLAT